MEPVDKGKRRGCPLRGRFALPALSIASSQAILSRVKEPALSSAEENRIAQTLLHRNNPQNELR
jgi:hypothetical protein